MIIEPMLQNFVSSKRLRVEVGGGGVVVVLICTCILVKTRKVVYSILYTDMV